MFIDALVYVGLWLILMGGIVGIVLLVLREK